MIDISISALALAELCASAAKIAVIRLLFNRVMIAIGIINNAKQRARIM